MYQAKNRQQAQALTQLLKLHHETGGRIVSSPRSGFPMIVFFSPSQKYTICYWPKDRNYTVDSRMRASSSKPNTLFRNKSYHSTAQFVEQLFY